MLTMPIVIPVVMLTMPMVIPIVMPVFILVVIPIAMSIDHLLYIGSQEKPIRVQGKTGLVWAFSFS